MTKQFELPDPWLIEVFFVVSFFCVDFPRLQRFRFNQSTHDLFIIYDWSHVQISVA